MITPDTPAKSPRLSWVDITKGISIYWIALFHFFITYDNGKHPWPLKLAAIPSFVRDCAHGSLWVEMGCSIDALLAAFFQRGSQAVGVFVVLSGFGLTYALAKTGHPQGGWVNWYKRRLLRLFPMYWLSHILILISPFTYLHDPVDYRFFLSLMGDRVYPAETLFYYYVPAWWFFGLLVELYIVFPLLFRSMQKLGPVRFLALSAFTTIVSRYILFDVLHSHGNYSQGAFFGARLWEFAAGMVLAFYYRHHPALVEEHLFSRLTLCAGIVLYTLGTYSYQPTFTYTLTDAFTGIGLFIIIANVSRRMEFLPTLRSALVYIGAYSYGIYLLHQPYVMHFGEKLNTYGMGLYTVSACAIVGGIALLCIPLEIGANSLTKLLLDRPRTLAPKSSHHP